MAMESDDRRTAHLTDTFRVDRRASVAVQVESIFYIKYI